MVVDASGRSSRAADWLAAAGREAPPVLVVDGKLAYATRFYRPREGYTGLRAVGALLARRHVPCAVRLPACVVANTRDACYLNVRVECMRISSGCAAAVLAGAGRGAAILHSCRCGHPS